MSDTAAHCIQTTAAIMAIGAVLIVCVCTNHDGVAVISAGLAAISGLGGYSLGRVLKKS
jgi:hypothetical protein